MLPITRGERQGGSGRMSAMRELIKALEPQADEWAHLYPKDIKIIFVDENKPFLRWKDALGSPFSDIQFFISPEGISQYWEHKSHEIEAFCAMDLVSRRRAIYSPGPSPKSNFDELNCPRAWMSDTNITPHKLLLSATEFADLLELERFPESSRIGKASSHRRIYVNHPDGSHILALLKTSSQSHVEGLRLLLANYVTRSPSPYLSVSHSDSYGACFIFLANLPFQAIKTRDEEDARSFSRSNRRLRRRFSLSFLNPKQLSPGEIDEDPVFLSSAFLHEANFCLMLTGKCDDYWTVICFNEDAFEHRPRIEDGVQYGEMEDKLDPITLRPHDNNEPRTYFLEAIQLALQEIVGYQMEIKSWFEASLDRHSPGRTQNLRACLSPQEATKWTRESINRLGPVIDTVVRLNRELHRFFYCDESQSRVFGTIKNKLSIMYLNSIGKHTAELENIEREFSRIKAEFMTIRDEIDERHKEENLAKAMSKKEGGEKTQIMLTILQFINMLCWGMLQLAAQLFGPSLKTVCMILGLVTALLSTLALVYLNIRHRGRISQRELKKKTQ